MFYFELLNFPDAAGRFCLHCSWCIFARTTWQWFAQKSTWFLLPEQAILERFLAYARETSPRARRSNLFSVDKRPPRRCYGWREFHTWLGTTIPSLQTLTVLFRDVSTRETVPVFSTIINMTRRIRVIVGADARCVRGIGLRRVCMRILCFVIIRRDHKRCGRRSWFVCGWRSVLLLRVNEREKSLDLWSDDDEWLTLLLRSIDYFYICLPYVQFCAASLVTTASSNCFLWQYTMHNILSNSPREQNPRSLISSSSPVL